MSWPIPLENLRDSPYYFRDPNCPGLTPLGTLSDSPY